MPSPFGFAAASQNRREARSPQVRTHTFIAQPPHLRHPSLGHKSFMVSCPLALLGNAFYAVLVHRLTIYAPRFLPTLGRPCAVALHFAHCDQLAAGLAPAGVRPCWAHKEKALKPCDFRAYLLVRLAGADTRITPPSTPLVSKGAFVAQQRNTSLESLQQPSSDSAVCTTADGRHYVVFRNVSGLLAVYRVRTPDGTLKRWPAELEE